MAHGGDHTATPAGPSRASREPLLEVRAALKLVTMQGGVFGAVADSTAVLACLERPGA
jgi:hypothetical protein